MLQIAKGANVELSSLSEVPGSITMALSWTDPDASGEADVSVLLLDHDGKVRGDQDFIFYNQPSSADGSVQLLGKTPTGSGSEDRILLDLDVMAPEVTRLVVAASRYEGATFGDLDDLRLNLSDGSGEHLLTFEITDADTETAFLFGELYRRNGAWKFRAVGQGYDSGLSGLATDFGIEIDDKAEESQPDADQDRATTPVEPPSAEVPKKPEQPGRLRTAKKRSTLPKAVKVNLAEDPAWQGARLFSVAGLRNDQERETRATSTLLAVMAQVPEFGRRLTARFNAPAGTLQTFAEASFKHGDTNVRPDGVVRVARAGRIWTALIETKTGGNPLKQDQVEAYLAVAAKNGYETVITLSNDIALDDEHPITVDKRRLKKVALRHLSWAEVAHEAHMLCHHQGLANPVHAWLLNELLNYLRQHNAGCHGFQDMGPGWVAVRNAITAGTLRLGDKRAMQVAESWEKLVRQLCLRLSGETGLNVAPVVRRRRGDDSAVRRMQTVASLVESGRMIAEIRIPRIPNAILIEADLRTGQIETTAEVPAAERARALTRVQWLLRQLTEAPSELRIEALSPGQSSGACELLSNARTEPGLLIPDESREIASFRLTLPTSMGTKRGSEEAGFIRSVDIAIDRFVGQVLQALKLDASVAEAS